VQPVLGKTPKLRSYGYREMWNLKKYIQPKFYGHDLNPKPQHLLSLRPYRHGKWLKASIFINTTLV